MDTITPLNYDLQGWTYSKDKQPTPQDYPLWTWNPEVNHTALVHRGPIDGLYWKSASIPERPRRLTEEEIEVNAILDAWRGQGVDFAQGTFRDIGSDFSMGWYAARKWMKEREGVK